MKFNAFMSIFILVAVFVGCTKDFEELDRPKTTSDLTNPQGLFTRSLVTGSGLSYTLWQYQHQIGGSSWAQHWANINPDFRWDNYEPTPGNTKWDYMYARTHFAPLNLIHHVINITQELENPVMESIARIWNVYMFQFVTDTYGDVPYFRAFKDQRPVFDPQEAIYMDMIGELINAVGSLKANRGRQSFGEADVLYQGDIDKWISFANSLTLRLALRISNVTEVSQFIDNIDPAQTINIIEHNAQIYPDPGGPTDYVKNPMSYVHGWHEVRLSQTMYDILVTHNDPRLQVFASPNSHGEYVGLPNGQHPDSLRLNYNSVYRPDYCNIGEFFIRENNPIYLLTAAESFFLKAEAAYRFNFTGNVQEYYEEGIRASMRQFEIDEEVIDEYLLGPAAFDPEIALEQIYTQRWIALYPNGAEAWALVRRTGYPQMQPLVYHWPDNDEMPRRKPYPINERRYNQENYQAAVNRMGGDSQYTRVWWDGGN